METYEHDSNCHSSQPFSLYDHYMRSFHRTGHYYQPLDSVESANHMYKAGRSSNTSNAFNLANTSTGGTDTKQNVFDANKCSTKTRTSIHLQVEDDEPLLQCDAQNFKVSTLSVSRALEPGSVDINLEPNKENCLIHNESAYSMREYSSSDCSEVCQTNEIGLQQTVYSTLPLCDSLSFTNENSTTHQLQSNIIPPELPTSSDDTRSDQSLLSILKPVLTTSLITMENSNNAVDSARLFDKAKSEEETSNNVFKLPYNELSFNGTLKQLQKLKPIVDPSAASCADNVMHIPNDFAKNDADDNILEKLSRSETIVKSSFISSETVTAESNFALSNSNDTNLKDRQLGAERCCSDASHFSNVSNADSTSRQHSESSFNKSSESIDHSFNGINSPNMFSDDDEECGMQNLSRKTAYELALAIERHETCDKFRVTKMEKTLQGVLPPPSVTTFNLDVTDMLRRYKDFLPIFNGECKPTAVSTCQESCTPPRDLPIGSHECIMTTSLANSLGNTTSSDRSLKLAKQYKRSTKTVSFGNYHTIIKQESNENRLNGSLNSNMDDISNFNVCYTSGTEEDALQLTWPNILKCRYFGLHYNASSYAEQAESLAMKCSERYVSRETASSCTVFSESLMSPSSAQKRKVIRAKMASAKSPGRRLSHLARRRQVFCSAATLAENAHASASRMVLIDKKKLTSFQANRKSPRGKQTPGKKTQSRKTIGMKTPGRKTPGSSSNKCTVRRLLIDPDVCTRSQPTIETSKRALFLSPENSNIPQNNSQSAPRPSGSRPFKSKRALFSSPDKLLNVDCGKSNSSSNNSKFIMNSNSDNSVCGKRKHESSDFTPGQRCKVQKSLSFGGDSIQDCNHTGAILTRRATECFSSKKGDLNELHKKKLLWAVAEALRAHGCTLGDGSFRAWATALARLTRRLLALPPHAAALADSRASTSDTMLKLARQYVFSIIRGSSVEELLLEEQMRLAARGPSKLTGYISLGAYHQHRSPAAPSAESRENDNSLSKAVGKCVPRSDTKNVLQDKMVNVNSKSQQFAGTMSNKSALFKSNSMPSMRDSAKMRACRQISFDNIDETLTR